MAKTAEVKATDQKTDTLIVAPTKLRVSTSIKKRGQTEQSESNEEIIEIHKFVTAPAVVKISIPLKMTANYQSIGVEFGLERPCYLEEVDKAADEAYAFVFEKIQAKIPEIQQTLLDISK